MMRPTYEEFQLPEEYMASDNNKKLELKFDQADNTSLSSLKDSGYRSVSEVLYSFLWRCHRIGQTRNEIILVDIWDLESLSYICGYPDTLCSLKQCGINTFITNLHYHQA